MSKKSGLGALLGFAAGVGAAFLAHKINKEINAMPSETGSYKEKASKWIEVKKDDIKNAVDVKRQQIKDISLKAKEALIGEDSAEKRKEIMDKASQQIAVINEEIQTIISKGAKEVSAIANKISNSEMFADITEFFSSLKDANKDIVDVDYTFEADYTEEEPKAEEPAEDPAEEATEETAE